MLSSGSGVAVLGFGGGGGACAHVLSKTSGSTTCLIDTSGQKSNWLHLGQLPQWSDLGPLIAMFSFSSQRCQGMA